MKMKNMRFLALAAIFVTGSIAPMYGLSADERVILSGSLVGACVGTVLGVQKVTLLFVKEYKESLGVLTMPLAGLLGASVGFVGGWLAGGAGTEITLKVTRSIREKIKLAKIKIEKMKQQYL